MNYRIEDLAPSEFEELCARICIKILGDGFVNFSQGKDEGKDGRFVGKANSFPAERKPFEGKFIVQAKHTKKSICLLFRLQVFDCYQKRNSKNKKIFTIKANWIITFF